MNVMDFQLMRRYLIAIEPIACPPLVAWLVMMPLDSEVVSSVIIGSFTLMMLNVLSIFLNGRFRLVTDLMSPAIAFGAMFYCASGVVQYHDRTFGPVVTYGIIISLCALVAWCIRQAIWCVWRVKRDTAV